MSSITSLINKYRQGPWFLKLWPLLGCFSLVLELDFSIIHPKYEKYGQIGPYFSALCIGLTILLILDKVIKSPESWPTWLKNNNEYLTLIVGSLLLRICVLPFESADYIQALSIWYDFFIVNGPWDGLGKTNANLMMYNGPYLYLMSLSTLLPFSKIVNIKLISIGFDYFLSYQGFLLLRELDLPKKKALLGSIILLFIPTVFLNSSLWSQCDAIYTSFILLSIRYSIKANSDGTLTQNSHLSILFLGIAYSCKQQALFVILPFVALYLRNKIRIEQILWLPFVYIFSNLPSLLAGRPWGDTFLVYAHQTINYNKWSLCAPNWYQWIGGVGTDSSITYLGLGVTLLFSIFWLLKEIKLQKNPLSTERLVQLFLFSSLIYPFLLPRMHERYFFIADVLVVIYTLYSRKNFTLAVCIQAASLGSYLPFLFQFEPISLKILGACMGYVVCIFIKNEWKSYWEKFNLYS